MEKYFIVFSFFLIITFSIADSGWTQAKQETHASIITHAYAPDRGPYGTIWKIYVETEDTDLDMDYVALVVNQLCWTPNTETTLKDSFNGTSIVQKGQV